MKTLKELQLSVYAEFENGVAVITVTDHADSDRIRDYTWSELESAFDHDTYRAIDKMACMHLENGYG